MRIWAWAQHFDFDAIMRVFTQQVSLYFLKKVKTACKISIPPSVREKNDQRGK
jgi:hypothetical protein